MLRTQFRHQYADFTGDAQSALHALDVVRGSEMQPDMGDTAPQRARPCFTRNGVVAGIQRMLPLTVGNIAFGMVFGMLAGGAGLGPVEAVAMSALVYSGSAQVAALDLWRESPPVATIWITTALVSVRYLVLGASLRPWLDRVKPRQMYGSLFLLADQSWALALVEYRAGRRDAGFLLGSGIALFVTWVAGTAIGRLAGGLVTDHTTFSLDFAPTAIFVALLAGLTRGRSDLAPWLAAAAVAIAAHSIFPGSWYVALGAGAGIVVGMLRERLRHEQ
jgi:4-azaleucine resistance transporter AzlC